ncbi:germin-like protein subfamily 1 member 11 [Malania oleifera]|uniref:germin-like protein subfamily 1 member 11 n=1 Tax=Malania oleifera TaxID=397392 RepID=UPI0025AE85E5|nr:germin-like protein subfamily 1 member 11 [Malania oleifera]XP_057962356.1 germin-like protein subfamily 1 member 11 [Malania oleifera]
MGIHSYFHGCSTVQLAVLLALACSVAFAADPNPLQDFCVAVNSTNDAVFVNGKICKDPQLATADDFFASGIHMPRNTSNPLGSLVTIFNDDVVPGLNTLGVSIARVDFAPGGVNPPHFHPRASEIFVVTEGTLYAGFVPSNPDHRLFSKILNKGDAFVFPMGLIHFQLNLGNTSAVAMASFGSQNGGVTTVANTIFGSNSSIDPDVLTKAFQLDEDAVERLQNLTWFSNAL